MYARFATYSYTGDAYDLARRAEAGVLPIFEAQPGASKPIRSLRKTAGPCR